MINTTGDNIHKISQHFPIHTSSDLETIMNTPMTRDTGLNRTKKKLPTLNDFIHDCVNRGEKNLLDLCAGSGALADDIQTTYNKEKDRQDYIRVQRIDILPLKERISKDTIGGRVNGRLDIKNLPNGLPSTYSTFGGQYIKNAPDLIENIRSKLKPGCRSYRQFPQGLWSKKLLDEFIKKNTDNNVLVYIDDANPSFKSIIFETRKNSSDDKPLIIPEYTTQKNLPLERTDTKEKVKNSELFYHFFSNNDPEYEEIQTPPQTN